MYCLFVFTLGAIFKDEATTGEPMLLTYENLNELKESWRDSTKLNDLEALQRDSASTMNELTVLFRLWVVLAGWWKKVGHGPCWRWANPLALTVSKLVACRFIYTYAAFIGHKSQYHTARWSYVTSSSQPRHGHLRSSVMSVDVNLMLTVEVTQISFFDLWLMDSWRQLLTSF